MGFSTGRFVGQALEVQTTHLKQGWLRRNGLPESDQATMVEFFVRHGDHLTHTSVISDPVYLAEPEIRSTDFARQPIDHQTWLFACDDGPLIREMIAEVATTSGRVERPVTVTATCPSASGAEAVARFTLTLSLKRAA